MLKLRMACAGSHIIAAGTRARCHSHVIEVHQHAHIPPPVWCLSVYTRRGSPTNLVAPFYDRFTNCGATLVAWPSRLYALDEADIEPLCHYHLSLAFAPGADAAANDCLLKVDITRSLYHTLHIRTGNSGATMERVHPVQELMRPLEESRAVRHSITFPPRHPVDFNLLHIPAGRCVPCHSR
ncbi:hypothetical protein IF2G_10707 [Cordyceps javanica]|nr:hypothetical protein IF2G_10707 [Cordyceps javanica]